MAYTTKLDMGYPQTLVQNQVYALPSVETTVFSTLALDIGNEPTFAVPGTIAAVTPTICSAAFVRCTTGSPIVTLKRD